MSLQQQCHMLEELFHVYLHAALSDWVCFSHTLLLDPSLVFIPSLLCEKETKIFLK